MGDDFDGSFGHIFARTAPIDTATILFFSFKDNQLIRFGDGCFISSLMNVPFFLRNLYSYLFKFDLFFFSVAILGD